MMNAVHTVQQHIAQAFPHIDTTHNFPGHSFSTVSHSSFSPSPSFNPVTSPPVHIHETPTEKAPEPHVHGVKGVHSFVDSTRVHAGEGIDTGEGDPDIASHIPTDLWREDIKAIHGQGVKEHKDFRARSGKPRKLVRRKVKAGSETS